MSYTAAVPGGTTLERLGGWSALALGGGYVAIVGLYSVAGAVPGEAGEAWLRYLDGQAVIWWGIIGLSVLTDLLFLPIAVALHRVLRESRTLALTGAGLLGLFVVLDLAVTWPNYASLMALTDSYSAAADAATRSIVVAGALYASTVLSSPLFRIYAILVPSLGIGALGLAALRSGFSRWAGWVGVATAVLGTVAVVGGIAWSALGSAVIATSVLTTLWLLIVGYRLLRPAR